MKNVKKMPNHVAIIPDGNRRWASDKKVKPWDGHDAGAKMIESIVKKARDMRIKHVSFWGSSVDNMNKRPLKERMALVEIYEKYFTKLISDESIFKDEVQINVIGNWKEQLPGKLVKILEVGIEKTKNHNKYHLNFFLAYSGDLEMLETIRRISQKYSNVADITKDVVKENLLTKDIPAVDYLIRTGGEPHLSAGFMMWDIANAQLFFSNKNFPDFNGEEFKNAIDEYLKRGRRLGA